jgi:hypothetical protein
MAVTAVATAMPASMWTLSSRGLHAVVMVLQLNTCARLPTGCIVDTLATTQQQ